MSTWKVITYAPTYSTSVAVILLFRDLKSQKEPLARHIPMLTKSKHRRYNIKVSITNIIVKEFAQPTEVLPHANTAIDAYLSYLPADKKP